MISIARATESQRDPTTDATDKWCCAGQGARCPFNAERSFRRIKGYKQMPQLIAALKRHAHPATEQVL